MTLLTLFCQALETLSKLHHMGYLHRDIKPSNLVFKFDSERKTVNVYTIDFGLARKVVDDEGVVRI